MNTLEEMLQINIGELQMLEESLINLKIQVTQAKFQIETKKREISRLRAEYHEQKRLDKAAIVKRPPGRPRMNPEDYAPSTKKLYARFDKPDPAIANHVTYIASVKEQQHTRALQRLELLKAFTAPSLNQPAPTQEQINEFYFKDLEGFQIETLMRTAYEIVVKGGISKCDEACWPMEIADLKWQMQNLIQLDLYLHQTFNTPLIYPTIDFSTVPSKTYRLPHQNEPITTQERFIVPTKYEWPSVLAHEPIVADPIPLFSSTNHIKEQ